MPSQSNEIFDNDTSLTRYGMFGSIARPRWLCHGSSARSTAPPAIAFATITNDIQKGRNAGEEIVWDDQSNTGYVLGGGLEYAFSDRWLARAEYLYANYGMVTLYQSRRQSRRSAERDAPAARRRQLQVLKSRLANASIPQNLPRHLRDDDVTIATHLALGDSDDARIAGKGLHDPPIEAAGDARKT